MRLQRAWWLAVAGLLGAACIAPHLVAQETVGTGVIAGGKALANQVNDPTEPITLLQLRNLFAPAWTGSPGGATVLEEEFVFPIAEGRLIPVMQLTRTTLPYLWLPDEAGGEAGFGDISYFDIGLLPTKWGRWGPGLTLVIPTGASTTALTQGKWQLGPAMAVIISKIPDLQFGLVLQNPISIAGPSERPSVSALSIQPTLTYNFAGGWFGGFSDFSFSFDWTDGGAATIPVGLQVGKVTTIGSRHFVLSVEAATLVARPDDQGPEWLIGLEAAWVIKLHPRLR
ncbi:MAG TPA: hypothetical protein PK948_03910 [Gemmatimonadales bacterium]|nr:hypothetical protein [Gemmatimonadales bacterium]